MSGRETKKRHSSQPLGGEAKDSRSEVEAGTGLGSSLAECTQAGDMLTWSQVTGRGRGGGAGGGGGGGRGALLSSNRFGLLSQANSYPDRSMRSSSVSSRGSRRGTQASTAATNTTSTARSGTNQDEEGTDLTYSESSLGPNTKFVTPSPDGAFRDDFAIEFQQINGRPFKGSITVKEARNTVFKEILGFNPKLLHSIRPVFGGTPTIRFKLKEQINLDDLTRVEYFDLERKINQSKTDIISCRIMGIRGMQSAPNYDGTSNDVRWIKIENCQYELEEEQILEWLRLYGQPLSLLGEDVMPDSDSEDGLLGNGTYSLKMKLVKDVPQFLPMHGRKIRVYFKNMTKLCTNCYGCHTRRQCTNERVPWINYVRDFMQANPDIDESFYGKWWDIVDGEFPGYFDQSVGEANDAAKRDEESNKQSRASAEIPSFRNPTRFAPPQPQGDHQRQSRDPRIQKQQLQRREHQGQDQDEISTLMQRGLTLSDAENYVRNRREQQRLEERMREPGTSEARETRNTTMSIAKFGPTSSGRGGLSFN